MTTLAGWDFATKFRDVIVQICEGVVERMRPAQRYATVTAIDRTARSCTVTFPGETGSVQVAMGSLQPAAIGQTVRIAGTLGDRYIDDVMGNALIAGGVPIGSMIDWPLATAPNGWVLANGAYLDPATYPSLFVAYGYGFGQQGALFKVPTSAGQIIRAS